MSVVTSAGVTEPDFAWLGFAWVGFAWLGFAWVGFAWVGFAWVGFAWVGFAWVGFAWVEFTRLVCAWLEFARLVFARLVFAWLDFARIEFARLVFARLVFAWLDFARIEFTRLEFALGVPGSVGPMPGHGTAGEPAGAECTRASADSRPSSRRSAPGFVVDSSSWAYSVGNTAVGVTAVVIPLNRPSVWVVLGPAS